ncbi:MAG: hypothetical protein WBQ89_12875 [Candidatus Acidiferrum sp.]
MLAVLALGWPLVGQAQTVRVDATPSHVVNVFSPPYALGSTVDRVPSNATDPFFKLEAIQKILSAGWGTISYRQKGSSPRSLTGQYENARANALKSQDAENGSTFGIPVFRLLALSSCRDWAVASEVARR